MAALRLRPGRRQQRQLRLPISLIWLLLITVILAFSGTAFGQNGTEVRSYLERTDELIENGKSIITDAGSRNAAQMLEQAEHMQKNAWDAYNRHQWRQALMFSERARDEVYRGLGNIRQSEDNESEVERQLDRTDNVLRDAQDRLGVAPRMGPRRRLEMASNMQRRAWDLYHERRLRPSLQLTLQARQMVLRLADDVAGSGPADGIGQQDIEVRLERLREAIDRVSDRVNATNNAEAQQNVEAAKAALDDAQRAYDSGDYRAADKSLITARRHLEHAMQTVVQNIQTGEISTLIAAAQERWNLAEQSVNDSGDDQLREWLRQAAENLDRARAALSEGNNQRALVQTRRAIEFLDRIYDDLGS